MIAGTIPVIFVKRLWTPLEIDQLFPDYEACTSLSYSGSNVGFSFVKHSQKKLEFALSVKTKERGTNQEDNIGA